jgi:hypothetical protein
VSYSESTMKEKSPAAGLSVLPHAVPLIRRAAATRGIRIAGAVWAAVAAFGATACDRDSRAATAGHEEHPPPAMHGGCAHAACGDDFFVDAEPAAGCTAGQACTLALTLVAAGDYHINDDYPYKFRAEDTPGLDFLGTDAAGKNVFSKLARNWTKKDEKSGTMAVGFKPLEKGNKGIVGVFKLSVCSSQNCRLEQQHINATVAVR